MAATLARSLSRLNRDTLLKLCLQWSTAEHSHPYLATNRRPNESEEEDYLHDPAQSERELRQLYRDMSNDVSGATFSKRDIIDRIIDGDWRRGLTLQQHAEIDLAYLEQNDTALRWTALKLVPLQPRDATSANEPPLKKRKSFHIATDTPHYPAILPSTFLVNLKSLIGSLVKAQYTIHLHSSGTSIIRLYIVPNAAFAPSKSHIPKSPKQATDGARVLYIALPPSCPYVYVSLSGSAGKEMANSKVASETRTKVDLNVTKRIILEAIPKAVSRPQERWSLEATKLTTKSLKALSLLRGGGRPGTAGGAFAIFSQEYNFTDDKENSAPQPTPSSFSPAMSAQNDGSDRKPRRIVHVSPLDPVCPKRQRRPDQPDRAAEIEERFGDMTVPSHARLDRFHIHISNILCPPPCLSRSHELESRARRTGRKRKRRSLEEIENGDHSTSDVLQQSTGRGPRQKRGQEDGNDSNSNRDSDENQPVSVSISFSGNDVFAGLKALAEQGEQYVDLNRLPAWMTGERGISTIVV